MAQDTKLISGVLRKIEWSAALLLTVLAVFLHVVFLRHAGALWRDETGSVNLALMPRLGDMWSHLYYDSFPIFWLLVARVWAWLGLGSDGGLRVLGFLTGVTVIGALWFNARRMKIGFPFFSLVLIGFCPAMIIWGDSLRAWGWGVFWILLTFGLVWQVVESPTKRNIVLAAAAAVGSVQSTYYNAVLLFGICTAGAVVASRRRHWRTAGWVLGVGAVAAVTMLPYVGTFRRGVEQYRILRQPFGLDRFGAVLSEAVSGAGDAGAMLWVLLAAAGAFVAVAGQLRLRNFPMESRQSDLLLFAATALGVGTAGYFCFLRNLQFETHIWYYTGLLAVGAMAIDMMLSILNNQEQGRMFRLMCAGFAVVFLFPAAWGAVRMRMTNVDAVARLLNEQAGDKDLIVVQPWYYGVSFNRYYSGRAPWTTLPAMPDQVVHHYDTVRQYMMQKDQPGVLNDVFERIESTLKSGNRVWLVGQAILPPPGASLEPPPPAPNGPQGWYVGPYQITWAIRSQAFLKLHVRQGEKLPLPDSGPVNPFELLPVAKVEGWREE